MPTILTHAAIPLTLGVALGPTRIPRRLLLAGMFAAIVPDMDVIAFKLGIEYANQLGHRGASHSPAFALALGGLAALLASWLRTRAWVAWAFVSLACASHPLLDMCTTGGLGVALWWPFSDQRLFFPAQFIKVSPLTLERLLGPAGIAVIKSEIMWVWLPCLAFMLAAWDMRTRPPAFHATPNGVFKPVAKTREIGVYGIAIALALIWHFAGNGRMMGAVGIFSAMAVVRYVQLRSIRPDGEPIVAIEDGKLLFRNPGFRRMVEQIPLRDIEQVKVYGQQGNRHYRFLLAGQEAKDLSLLQNNDAEQAVISFLQDALQEKVVIAKAPETFFERVRGERA